MTNGQMLLELRRLAEGEAEIEEGVYRRLILATLAELYEQIDRMPGELQARLVALQKDADRTAECLQTGIDHLNHAIYRGHEGKPGLQSRIEGLERNMTLAHAGQSVLTLMAAAIAAWLGSKK